MLKKSSCPKIFVQKCKIWRWNPLFSTNFAAKLIFWATIISFIGNLQSLSVGIMWKICTSPSENCKFLFCLLFLTHEGHDVACHTSVTVDYLHRVREQPVGDEQGNPDSGHPRARVSGHADGVLAAAAADVLETPGQTHARACQPTGHWRRQVQGPHAVGPQEPRGNRRRYVCTSRAKWYLHFFKGVDLLPSYLAIEVEYF